MTVATWFSRLLFLCVLFCVYYGYLFLTCLKNEAGARLFSYCLKQFPRRFFYFAFIDVKNYLVC